MKKNILFILLFLILATCSRKPSKIIYGEIKGYKDWINPVTFNKLMDRAYKDPEFEKKTFKWIEQETTHSLLVIGAVFKEPLNVTKLKYQLIDFKTKRVRSEENIIVNPELSSLQFYDTFPGKGKYTTLIIKNDQVIARGEITIK